MALTRAVASTALCVAVLGVGLVTAFLSATNSARSRALDRLQRDLDATRIGNERLSARTDGLWRTARQRADDAAAARAAAATTTEVGQ